MRRIKGVFLDHTSVVPCFFVLVSGILAFYPLYNSGKSTYMYPHIMNGSYKSMTYPVDLIGHDGFSRFSVFGAAAPMLRCSMEACMPRCGRTVAIYLSKCISVWRAVFTFIH